MKKIIVNLLLSLHLLFSTKKNPVVDLHKQPQTRSGKFKTFIKKNELKLKILLTIIILTLIFLTVAIIIYQTGSLDSTNYYYRLGE